MTGQISSITCEKIYIIMNELNLFKELPVEKQLLIEEKRDKNYQFEYDTNIPLKQQVQDKETMIVLSYLFLKYINKDKKIKQILLNRYKDNEIKYQQELKEKYNTNNLFCKESDRKIQNHVTQDLQMIECEKINLLSKLLGKIKDMFIRK